MATRNHPTLESVLEGFSEWRGNKTTSRTPENLQRQAVSLLKDYRVGEILKALSLSHKSLKRWSQRWSESASEGHFNSCNELLSFVALPAQSQAMPLEPEVVSTVSLKLSCQDLGGRTLAIEGNLEDRQWRWALELLSGQERV